MLTTEQNKAVELAVATLENGKSFLLKGYAGTGKSYVASYITQELRKKYHGLNFIGIAPTHKAVKILRSFLSSNNLYFPVATVASGLGKKLKLDYDTGNRILTDYGNEAIFNILAQAKNTIIICDEASMISKDLISAFIELENKGVRFLYLGDPLQLPPPKENESSIFNLGYNSFELINPVRYSGTIADICISLRELHESQLDLAFQYKDSDSYNRLTIFNFKRLISQYFSCYTEDNIDPNYAKFLCYTNKSVQLYNELIRETIFGCNEPFIVGELLMAQETITRKNEMGKDIPIIYNSEDIIVDKIFGKKDFKGIIYYDIEVIRLENYESYRLNVVHPNYQEQFDSRKNELKKKAILATGDEKRQYWNWYNTITDTFDDVRRSYALTIHKSQGSTYNNVFLYMPDIVWVKDKIQLRHLLYTGASRAKDHLYSINEGEY